MYVEEIITTSFSLDNISSITFFTFGNKEILSNVKTEIYIDNRIIIVDGYLDIGLIDTMEDLFVNFLGAVIFSYFCYFYILDNKKYKFLEIFIPKFL